MNRFQMQSVRVRVLRFAARGGALAWLVAAFAGCPGSLANEPEFVAAAQGGGTTAEGTSGSPATSGSGVSCDAPGMIITPTCAVADCHVSSALAFSMLDLSVTPLIPHLLNMPTSGGSPGAGQYYIDQADPAMSAMYTKVTNMPPFLAQMPWMEPQEYLSATLQKCMLDWVTYVANNAAPAAGTGEAGSDDAGQAAPPAGDDAGAGAGAGDDAGNNNTPPPSSSSSSSVPSSASSSTTAPPATEAGGAAISFATVYSTIISTKCVSCHGATPKGGLSLTPEMTAYTNLTTETSSATVEVGCNEKYVTTGDAMTSLLYQKVAGGALLPAACGVQMPKNGPPYLTAAQQTMIEDWINGGAMP